MCIQYIHIYICIKIDSKKRNKARGRTEHIHKTENILMVARWGGESRGMNEKVKRFKSTH